MNQFMDMFINEEFSILRKDPKYSLLFEEPVIVKYFEESITKCIDHAKFSADSKKCIFQHIELIKRFLDNKLDGMKGYDDCIIVGNSMAATKTYYSDEYTTHKQYRISNNGTLCPFEYRTEDYNTHRPMETSQILYDLFIEIKDLRAKNKKNEEVEAMLLYLSREIDQLKEHNKCLSARIYELEK